MLLLLLPLVTAPQAAWDATPFAPPPALLDTHEYDRFRPWKKNYFLLAWNPDLSTLPSPATGGENLNLETNFQLSIRSRISDGLLIPGWTGHVGYTGTSFWQMLDGKDSSPFRTTDHAPEIFGESGLIGGRWLFRVAPYSHQSNGESGLASRSWNRSWVEAVWHSDFDRLQVTSFQRDDLKDLEGVRIALKAWKEWRLYYNHVRPHGSLGYKPPAPAAWAVAAVGQTSAPLRSAPRQALSACD